MKKVQPPQLIEALISQQQKLNEISKIDFTVKTFNELARKIESIDYILDFSYRELLDFASNFDRDSFLIDQMELHLHITEELVDRLSWYNKIYPDIEEPLKIYNQWKTLGK